MDSTHAQLRTLADSERSSALDPNPDHLMTPPLSPQVATRFKLAGANVSRTDRATTGARTWGNLKSVRSDDEMWQRQSTVQRRSTGYGSMELELVQQASDDMGVSCTTDRGEPDDFVTTRRLESKGQALRSPADFLRSSIVDDGHDDGNRDQDTTIPLTQSQLMDIVRKACEEVTVATDGRGARQKRPDFRNSVRSPADVAKLELDGVCSPGESSERTGRSSAVRRSTETPHMGKDTTQVRWRFPSADDEEEFYDAPQSPSRSRSRSSASRTARSVSRDRRSTEPKDAKVDSTSPEGAKSSNSSLPGQPSDDSDGDKDDKGPNRRDRGRRHSPSPPRSRGPISAAGKTTKWMKPDKFSGTGSVDTFLAQFDICGAYNKWTEEDKAAHLKCSLTGVAGQLLWDTGRPDILTYTELRDKLRRRFGSDDQQEKFQAELRARRRRRGETLAELYQDIRRLMTLAYPGESTSSLCEQIAKDYFIAGLGDRDLELKIREREPRDLESAFKHAVRLEAYDRAVDDSQPQYKVKGNRGSREDGLIRQVSALERKVDRVAVNRSPATTYPPVVPDGKESAVADTAAVNDLKEAMVKLSRQNDELSKEVGRLRLLEEQRRDASARPNTAQATAPDLANSPALPLATARPTPKCYFCGEPGHFIRNCKKRKSDRTDEVKSATMRKSDATVLRGQTYLRLTINGKMTKCLLDTGSDVTLLPSTLVAGARIEPTDRRIRAANGTAIRVTGTATVEAHSGSHHMSITGLVSPHVSEVMLGIAFLKHEKALWNFDLGEIVLSEYRHKLCSRGRASWCRRVILQDEIVIPPESEVDLPTLVQYGDLSGPKREVRSNWVTEARELSAGICVARTVVPERDEDVPIRVINVTRKPVTMEAGTIVADLSEAEVCEVQGETETDCEVNECPGATLLGMVDDVDETVTNEDRRRLVSLLTEFSGTFSKGENDLGWTNIVTHSIDTGVSKPVRQPLRRHPPAHQDAIQRHVSDMLRQGVIEPAKSPWASNLVLVRKKDGTFRCCVDYRQVNAFTKKDAYPLPRTDMCLDAMSGARWFSTFDLRSSYHQVAMQGEDTEKTAFICREGQFKFRTMPFGLCNAGSTFQRLMDMVMAGLAFEMCLVYLDDVIVFSTTIEEHFERLRSVLSRLKDAGLKLKPSKCRLLQKHVAFLGHVVSEQGISTDPMKVEAVTQWPVPTNLREVRAFVGLCSYYRRFVKNFAAISAPLHNLAKKGEVFRWTQECQEAFDYLKEALTSAPVLAMPDDESPWLLDTDASNSAIGAVLSQMQNGVERVVAYASRKLSKCELNYCVTRKELLAVVHFVKYFKHYLLGRKFTVRTDHAALQWLRKIPEPVGQQARWIGFLEEFDFVVIHRPGAQHLNADALSRKPCRSGCCRAVTSVNDEARTSIEMATQPTVADSVTADVAYPRDEPIWSASELREAQLNDADINVIREWVSAGDEKPPWDEVAIHSSATKTLWHQWPRLEVRGGVLYRKFYSANGCLESLQLVVPFKFRGQFIELAHTNMTGGHLGRKRTEAQVQRRGYWPGWSEDVRRHLRSCGPCAQYHRGPPPRLAKLKPMLVGEPFERVSIDITGPHPRSAKGHVFILTLMDHFTKWAEAVPLRNHTASTVARALMVNVFSRFGVPLQLLSDRGPEFESELFAELCRWMEIDKVRTTAYHAAANGMVERYHRTLNSILGKIVNEDQRNWCEKVPIAAAAYRASVHEATGYSPNRLMLGHEVYAPLDVVLGYPREEAEHFESANEFVIRQQKAMRDVYATVREHLRVAASRRKKYYDIRVKSQQFVEGQWVYYYYPRRYLKKSPKWQRMYTGPYLIVRVLSPSNAVLQKSKRGKPFVVHFDKLKPFVGDPPTDWRLPTGVSTVEGHGDPVGPEPCYGEDRDVGQPFQYTDETMNDGAEEIVPTANDRQLGAEGQSIRSNVGGGGDTLIDRNASNERPVRVRRQPRHFNDFYC